MGKRKQKLLIAIVFGTLGVYLTFRFLFFAICPILIAISVGKLLSPCVRFLHRKCQMPKFFSIVMPVVLFFLLFMGGTYFILRLLGNQVLLFMQRLPQYEQWMLEEMDVFCGWWDGILFMEDGTVFRFVFQQVEQFTDHINFGGMSKITSGALLIFKRVLGWAGKFGVILILTCMVVKDMDAIRQSYRNCLFYKDLEKLFRPLTKVGFAYIKAQFIIISLVSLVCVVGFWLLGSPYSLLFGVFIGIFDAFPLLGSGLFFIPIVIFSFLDGSYKSGVVYLLMYGLCQIIRQFLEPKLIGDKIGISPIYILISVYLGMECYGISGVVLGPASLVLIKSFVDFVMEGEGK